MFMRRTPWAQLTRSEVPQLFVLRPHGNFTPPTVGEEFEIKDATDKMQLMRARQLYEQKRIGTLEELKLALGKDHSIDPELKAALELSTGENDPDFVALQGA
jgi:hypothetical protein